MGLTKIALNKMTKVLDALKTNAEKNLFKEKVFAGLNKVQEFKPTTLLHQAINRKAGIISGQLLRPEGQMAKGTMNYIDHNRREAGKVLGPIKTKFLQNGKESESHINLISKKMYIPKFDGNLEKSLIGAHESHEALEYAKDFSMHSKHKLKNIRDHLNNIKSNDDLAKIQNTVKNGDGHFNSAVLGHDSNLLSRNFHDTHFVGGNGALRGSTAEDTHFKNIAKAEFGVKVNNEQLHKLRYGFTEDGALKALEEKFYGIAKLRNKFSKISKKRHTLLDHIISKKGIKYVDHNIINRTSSRGSIADKILNDRKIMTNMSFGNHINKSNFFDGLQSMHDARLAFNDIADNYINKLSKAKRYNTINLREAKPSEHIAIDRLLRQKYYSYDLSDAKNKIKKNIRKKYGINDRYESAFGVPLTSPIKVHRTKISSKMQHSQLKERAAAANEYRRLDRINNNFDLPYDKFIENLNRFHELDKKYKFGYGIL